MPLETAPLARVSSRQLAMRTFPDSFSSRSSHLSCASTNGIRQISVSESSIQKMLGAKGGLAQVTPRSTSLRDGAQSPTCSARAQAGSRSSFDADVFLGMQQQERVWSGLQSLCRRDSRTCSPIHDTSGETLLRGIVVQVLSEPSFDFGYAHPFAFAIVGDLITTDLAQAEIARFWMGKIKTTHARSRPHGK